MKAFYLKSLGGPASSEHGYLPDPFIERGQLLIEVKAVSIDVVDYKVKNCDLKFIIDSKFQ